MTTDTDIPASHLHSNSNPMISGLPGAIISTDTLSVDRIAAEELHHLSHAYGTDAAAILVALRRELGHNIRIGRVIELASLGDPAFRAACEAHLVALRKDAAAQRVELVRARLRDDHSNQRNTLVSAIDQTFINIRRMRAERTMWEDMDRAGQAGPTGTPQEIYDRRDAEIEAFGKRLTRAREALATWDAAPDEKKSEIYDQVSNTTEETADIENTMKKVPYLSAHHDTTKEA